MTLAEKIADAEAKLHALLTGAAVVEVEVDGIQTKFRPADAAQLDAYLGRLRAELSGGGRRGAIGFVF